MSDLISRLMGWFAGTVTAIDLETYDPLLEERGPGWAFENAGHIIGVSLASEKKAVYLPIRHKCWEATPGDYPHQNDLDDKPFTENYDPEEVMEFLRRLMVESEEPVIFANANYDLGWLETEGKVWEHRRRVEDVQMQAPLLDEHSRSFGLDMLGLKYSEKGLTKLGGDLVSLGKSRGYRSKGAVMKSLAELPIGVVAAYAVRDAEVTLDVWYTLTKMIEQQNLQRVYSELEMPLLPYLRQARRRGIRVDMARAEEVAHQFLKLEEEATAKLKHETGIDLTGDLWKAEKVAKVLDYAGIPYPLTPKTKKPSIDKDFLNDIDNPITDMILQARKFERARSTFVEGFVMNGSINGRIHCQLNSLKSDDGGTISGRFSCSDPNLQQIPARDPEIGPLVRSCFLGDEECDWVSMDYSQQEPRWMVEMALRCGFTSSLPFVEAYQNNPKTDFHQLNADIAGIKRKEAKEIGLGLAYAMGGGKLARKLGLEIELKTFRDRRTGEMVEYEAAGKEAQAIIDKFHRGSPYINDLDKMCRGQVRSKGYLRTPLGRRFRFPILPTGEQWKPHKAMNALIQGSAADETKTAMLALYRAGIPPILSVHDEVALTHTRDREVIRAAANIMINAVPKTVPSMVDIEVGRSWGECVALETE